MTLWALREAALPRQPRRLGQWWLTRPPLQRVLAALHLVKWCAQARDWARALFSRQRAHPK